MHCRYVTVTEARKLKIAHKCSVETLKEDHLARNGGHGLGNVEHNDYFVLAVHEFYLQS